MTHNISQVNINTNTHLLDLKSSHEIYQWKVISSGIKSANFFINSLSFFALFFFISMGYFISNQGEQPIIYVYIFFGLIMGTYVKYVWFSPQCYDFRLTYKGIYFSMKQNIPDIVYTFIHIFSWIGILACIIAVLILGPMVFFGAGAFALISFTLIKFKQKKIEHYVLFTSNQIIANILHENVIILYTHPFKLFFYGELFCDRQQKPEIIQHLKYIINDYNFHEFDTYKQYDDYINMTNTHKTG